MKLIYFEILQNFIISVISFFTMFIFNGIDYLRAILGDIAVYTILISGLGPPFTINCITEPISMDPFLGDNRRG